MAIVEMCKMSLVAHKAERNKLMKAFIRLGCVETIRSEEIPETAFIENASSKEMLDSKLVRINFALSFLKSKTREISVYDKNTKAVALKKKNDRLVPVDEFEAISKEEVELFSKIGALEDINNKLVDLKSDTQRINSLLEQLYPYAKLPVPFSAFRETASTTGILGVVPLQSVETLKVGFSELSEAEFYPADKVAVVAVVCHKSEEATVKKLLSENEFVKCPFEFDVLPSKKIEELEGKRDECVLRKKEFNEKILTYVSFLPSLMTLFDYYTLEKAKLDVFANCAQTDKAFVLEGWIPKDKQALVEETIGKKCPKSEVYFREPLDSENPPTLTHNNKFTDSFENVTDMFGPPNYRETDPNIFVSIFYFIIFGFMFSDAGYGLILAITCLMFYFIKKPVKKSGRMILMFAFGGISTVIWGAVFGSWFAIDGVPGLINPLEGSGALIMFGLSLAIGAIQIATGFGINGYAQIKRGIKSHDKKLIAKGCMNDLSWVVIFLGLGLLVMGMLFGVDIVLNAGIYVALVGAVVLLAGGAIGKKNPLKMVTGAFGNAYGAINVVSDLLSYSRLFGLGLSTGVVGFVFNQMALIIAGMLPSAVSFIGWIFGVVILLVGHIFNFAINLLGVYVHNARLQYIEFFGRFYEGSGHAFAPLGSKTKYIYLDN